MTVVREQLADYAHEAWAGWLRYMFGKAISYKPGEVQAEMGALIIPKWAVDRWVSQMGKSYAELPEEMKESDRHEADRMIAIMTRKADDE